MQFDTKPDAALLKGNLSSGSSVLPGLTPPSEHLVLVCPLGRHHSDGSLLPTAAPHHVGPLATSAVAPPLLPGGLEGDEKAIEDEDLPCLKKDTKEAEVGQCPRRRSVVPEMKLINKKL